MEFSRGGGSETIAIGAGASAPDLCAIRNVQTQHGSLAIPFLSAGFTFRGSPSGTFRKIVI